MVEQLIDGFALFQPGQAPYCHKMGAASDRCALEPLVAALKRAMTQLQTLIKNFPELLNIAAGGKRHIRQVNGHNALVKPAIILVLAGLVVAGIGDIAHPSSVKRSGVKKDRQPMQVYTSPLSSSIFLAEM